MKTVARFTKAEDAHNLRAFLEGSGIAAFVRDESVVAADPLLANAIGGIRVDVGDSDLRHSLDLISTVSNHRSPATDEPA